MEAMALARPLSHSSLGTGSTRKRAGQLWQVPLLLASLGLFGYAAYLFIDPKPGPTLDQKLKIARTFLAQERPDAAIEQLNKLLSTEKLDKLHEGEIHLMLAEAISVAEFQKDKKLNIPRKHEQIIEQSKLALSMDVPPSYEIDRRMAESYEALHDVPDALKYYHAAMAVDPTHSIRMHRKIIELHLSSEDFVGGAAALEEYLLRKDLSDTERSWALCESAHLKIDAGSFGDAKSLLADAAVLSTEPVDQGQINFWLGYCAWKLGDPDETERYLRVARSLMGTRHPLDGDASYILGKSEENKSDWEIASSFYETVIVNHPDSRFAPLARLGRGLCRIAIGQDDAGLTDLHNITSQISEREEAKDGKAKFQSEVVEGLQKSADMLTKRGNYLGALELLAYEQSLTPDLQGYSTDRELQARRAKFFARLGDVYEKRGDQLEQTAASSRTADQLRFTQQGARNAGQCG